MIPYGPLTQWRASDQFDPDHLKAFKLTTRPFFSVYMNGEWSGEIGRILKTHCYQWFYRLAWPHALMIEEVVGEVSVIIGIEGWEDKFIQYEGGFDIPSVVPFWLRRVSEGATLRGRFRCEIPDRRVN